MANAKFCARPWGGYKTLHQTKDYWVKKLLIKKGARLSLQSHEGRSESWLVLSGKVRFQIGKWEKIAIKGAVAFIPARVKHRITGITTAEILETAVGKVHEHDIIRYADDYGRVKKR